MVLMLEKALKVLDVNPIPPFPSRRYCKTSIPAWRLQSLQANRVADGLFRIALLYLDGQNEVCGELNWEDVSLILLRERIFILLSQQAPGAIWYLDCLRKTELHLFPLPSCNGYYSTRRLSAAPPLTLQLRPRMATPFLQSVSDSFAQFWTWIRTH